MTTRRLRWMLVALTMGLVGCDHATKHAARSALADDDAPVTLVPGVLDLRYTENRDTAFGLSGLFGLPTNRAVLAAVQAGVLCFVAVFWWRRRREARLVEHAAFATIVAGAVGNLADRLLRGYVVDFIHLHHWPVFNVADVALVAGAGLLLLAAGSAGRAPPARAAGPPPRSPDVPSAS